MHDVGPDGTVIPHASTQLRDARSHDEATPLAARVAMRPLRAPVSVYKPHQHILATSPDNLANNTIMMAIEYRRRGFYAFEFYRIWPINNYIY